MPSSMSRGRMPPQIPGQGRTDWRRAGISLAAAFVVAAFAGAVAGQEPARARQSYGRAAPSAEPADDYNRYPSAAPQTQPWPEDAQPRYAPAAAADTADPPRQLPAAATARALPLHFEPAAGAGQSASAGNGQPLAARASDAAQASYFQPSPAPSAQEPGRLPLPAADQGDRAGPRAYPLPSVATLLGSLAVVLGLFLLLAWVLKLAMPKGATMLPRDAVEVLGRAPLAGRHQVHLIRCGNKILLVSVTPSGAETLTEITDPVEVDRLAGICYQSRPFSASANFRQLLQGFATERPASGRRRTRPTDELDLSSLAGSEPYGQGQGATHA